VNNNRKYGRYESKDKLDKCDRCSDEERIRPTLATDVQGIPRLIREAVSEQPARWQAWDGSKLGLHQERWHAVVDLGGSVMITVRVFSGSPLSQFSTRAVSIDMHSRSARARQYSERFV
jgi:hypothetical protein